MVPIKPEHASGAAGAKKAPNISALRTSDSSVSARAGPPRVCIVTGEIEGPFFNGGVGSTNRGLARALRALGCAVDILYTQVSEGRPVCLRGSFAEQVAEYARQGIRLLAIPNTAASGDWPARSWLALHHLMAERYEVVFFDDIFGTGYYPLLARRTGAPTLADTAMVVTAHGALEWVSEQDETAILNFDGLPLFEMERRCLELADVVKAPSRYILRKYEDYGWVIPDNAVVLPNFVSDPQRRPLPLAPTRMPVDEIVFFGRLETRKGIWLFLRAIDRIKYRLAGRTVTFLGKSRATADLIVRHSLGWPCKIRLLTNYNQDQAVAYLRGRGRLAVMPSPEDNSPSTVLECLDNGVPFLCSSGSGAEELIDRACHADVLVEPTVDRLAEKILETVEKGGKTARHAFDQDRLLKDFSGFLDQTLGLCQQDTAPIGPAKGRVAVIALAAYGLSPATIVAQLDEALVAMEPGAVVQILTDDPEALEPVVSRRGIGVLGPDGLPAAVALLAGLDLRAVVLCRLGSIPDTVWLARAEVCFAQGIQAVTGMTLGQAEPDKVPDDPWFSSAQAAPIDRFLIGNAPALMTLMQSTNSGFALLHPDLLDLLPSLDAVDPRHRRLRPASVIVHELMAAITVAGGRFELVPDLAAPPAVRDALDDRASEGPALKLAQHRLGKPEEALWAVDRLAVDAGTDRIRRAENQVYREALSQKLGFAIAHVAPDTPQERLKRDLSRMAAATGQAELAVGLLAGLHSSSAPLMPAALEDFVRDEAAAIHLAVRYRNGEYLPLNLIHHYSITAPSETELQLHANAWTEPRAGIAFPGIDLSGLDAFSARVSLPNDQTRPVRLRIDVLAETGPGHLAFERVLQPGQFTSLRLDLPRDLNAHCRAVIGLEMADPQAPNDHAYLCIANPRFLRLRRGEAG